ncbi:D-amino-acid dehydrogenase [Elstera cyanobacteriorum]|nr:D-amino-acid dehydrogenase [Elstera cyanobacteriorum]
MGAGDEMRIMIIGAGIIGVTAAHALLDAGCEVTLVDPGGIAAGASQGNAGWIAHVDILPLASPKAWRNLPRWLMDPLGPLAIRPAYLPTLAPWLLRFLAASRPHRVEASTRALADLNGQALRAWEDRLAGLGLGHHLRPRGFLTVWDNPALTPTMAALAKTQGGYGIPSQVLDRSGVTALEPVLEDGASAGGIWYPTGCHVSDPAVLTRALGTAALERGARLVQAEVRGLSDDGSRASVVLASGEILVADAAILAAGAWAKPLAAQVGDAVPLDTERGYNVTLPSGSLGLTRPVIFEGHGFVISPLDSGDRLGGAVEFAGLKAEPNYARVDALIARARRFVPNGRFDGGTRWMGFRPSIPDSLPVIGPSRTARRVFHAFGHGHYGLTQAAITAEILAAQVLGRPTPLNAAPFSAQRF